jgi:hypothetical protein
LVFSNLKLKKNKFQKNGIIALDSNMPTAPVYEGYISQLIYYVPAGSLYFKML